MDAGIKLGVALSCVDIDAAQRKAANAVAAGFTRCQITFRWDVTPGEALTVDEECRRLGMEVVACGAYINPLRPGDQTFHGASIRAAHGVIEAMHQSRFRRLVIWCGTYGRSAAEGDPRNWTPDARAVMLTQMCDLAARLRVHSGLLCVEPHYAHVLRTAEEYVALVDQVDPDVTRVVLDPPNLIPPDQLDRLPELVPRTVATLAPVAGLIHLKDITRNGNGKMAFPGPGRGMMDYGRFLAAIREHQPAVPAIIEHIDGESVSDMRAARQFVERHL